MRAKPVIAVIDVGKTNKKLFLFDQQYQIVYERSARFTEMVDEDGFPCEDLDSLSLSVFDALKDISGKKEFNVKAINFSAYGASFVNIDDEGHPVCPLYSYLKPYPEPLLRKFYDTYGGESEFSARTASPVLASLNSGMQLYRLKYENPDVFRQVSYALHLPQYLSYLISGRVCSDITSIGCHTNLWDFSRNHYHEWVEKEGIKAILAPIVSYDETVPAVFHGNDFIVGPGLHDSSAALIPYQLNFQEPFVLISTGTWCISLNPFNDSPLTREELQQDCLCYMHYQGKAVKASRLFAGQEHEDGIKRIAIHYQQDPVKFRNVQFNPEICAKLLKQDGGHINSGQAMPGSVFALRDLAAYREDIEAYHRLMMDIMDQQVMSTKLILRENEVRRIFVDGGFSKNSIYMSLLAAAFPKLEVYAASMAQATALGAALSIHNAWNDRPLPVDSIKLQYYAASNEHILSPGSLNLN